MEWSKSSDTNILFSLHLHDRQLHHLLQNDCITKNAAARRKVPEAHVLLHREPKGAAQLRAPRARVTGVTLLTHRP
jgi:hypothetical protein